MLNLSDKSKNNLMQFFGAYFHQDCMLEDPSWEAVVDRYINDSDQALIELTASGIDELLEKNTGVAALEKSMVSELGCYYLPARKHLLSWLSEIKQRLISENT